MNRFATIALLALVACTPSPERVADDALRAGNQHFRNGRYTRAAEVYGQAEDDARAMHNRGIAHHQLAAWTEATTDLQLAAQLAEDTATQVWAFHDLGHTLVSQAIYSDSLAKHHAEVLDKIRIEGDDVARKVSLYVLRDSLRQETRRLAQVVDSTLAAGAKAYKETLRLDPDDEDARHDLALTLRLIAQRPAPDKGNGGDKDDDAKKELGERARLLLEQADELVEQHRFQDALHLLQDGLKQDPTLEQRKEYMDKLETVTRAAAAT